jgi:hypothetical protein
MNYDKLFMMLSLSEKLMGHPRYAPVKVKIDKEIDAMVGEDIAAPPTQPAPRVTPISPHAIPAEPEAEPATPTRRI